MIFFLVSFIITILMVLLYSRIIRDICDKRLVAGFVYAAKILFKKKICVVPKVYLLSSTAGCWGFQLYVGERRDNFQFYLGERQDNSYAASRIQSC